MKFIKSADAASVLSQRGSLSNSTVSIKPDMSKMERKRESLLLKERWSLIQSGVPRMDIKIRGSRLLVKNKLHGCIKMSGSSLSYEQSINVQNSAVHTLPPSVPVSSTGAHKLQTTINDNSPTHMTPTLVSDSITSQNENSSLSQNTPSCQGDSPPSQSLPRSSQPTLLSDSEQ